MVLCRKSWPKYFLKTLKVSFFDDHRDISDLDSSGLRTWVQERLGQKRADDLRARADLVLASTAWLDLTV